MYTIIISLIIVLVIICLYLYWRSAPQPPTLYERLGGIYNIANLVNKFSEKILENPKVGKNSPNPQLQQWSRYKLDRLPGLKWMRTLWVCDVAGGPYKFVATRPGHNSLGLEVAHCPLHVSQDEFDEVVKILIETLDEFKVPIREKNEVLGAFMAHKGEVTSSHALPSVACSALAPFSSKTVAASKRTY